MKWIKQGRIFEPRGQAPWVETHGMLPTPYQLQDDLYRIYFSGRNRSNQSSVGYIDVDITNPHEILNFSEKPVLECGPLGSFDDNGVSPVWITKNKNELYLYYFGWNIGSRVSASEVSGLAISKDNGNTFERYSPVPIIDRTKDEPYLILVVCCTHVNEDGIWRMWYDSADCWLQRDLPHYNIKYAVGTDGIHWNRPGLISVDYKYPNESRVSKASVLKEDGIYKMWYCYAIGKSGYNMGYGESVDGAKFERKDEQVGIYRSESGWDSEMICYPSVFDHKGTKYMLYCGNSYGRTGFGLATLEK
jgi:hypothetical protein